MPKVILATATNAPLRLSPGDVIRCEDFALGIRMKADRRGLIQVAWQDPFYPEYHVKTGAAEWARDPARGQASFLLLSVALTPTTGPEDVAPGELRFSRELVCVRLNQHQSFEDDSERIAFNLNEPMSIAQPLESRIMVVGTAELPIRGRATSY